MRLLVCGGTDFDDWDLLSDELTYFLGDYGIDVVIEGEAKGADLLSRKFAEECEPPIQVLPFPANWKKYGKAAGPVRNQQMLDEGKPDFVIAFPTPNSRGTWDMVRRAKKALGDDKVRVIGP